MRAALPLLRTTEPVQILSVDGDSEEFPAARAVEYLSYHDLRAEVHWRSSEGRTVAEAILALARQREIGLIVAGAFGHNRIREMLLGSVTRALLKSSPLPLLLAH
jgi:nucleotide-binding universal stress UspA family protein